MKGSLALFLLLLAAACLAVFWQTDRANRSAPPILEIRQDSARKTSLTIRVNLTENPVTQLTLAVDGAYTVRPVHGDSSVAHAEPLPASDVTRTRDGFQIGQQRYRGTELEIVPGRPPAIWVDDHQYRGSVRLVAYGSERFLAVNAVRLEHYLASVVDSEMPAAFPDAARRAQAIVARTYALYQMQSAPPAAPFDLYASTRSQKYLGFQYRDADGRRLAGESENSRRIVSETAKRVCTYLGKLFSTYYSAVCGGRTARGADLFADAAAPLESVPCRWCRAARFYRWTTRLPKLEAGRRLERYFAAAERPFGRLQSIRRLALGRGQTIPQFEVSDGQHRIYVPAVELRQQLPPATLLSPQFIVQEAADEFIFHGRGHGHGAGLCQWGARGLALAGKTSLEIIAHYYPGSQVVDMDGQTLARQSGGVSQSPLPRAPKPSDLRQLQRRLP